MSGRPEARRGVGSFPAKGFQACLPEADRTSAPSARAEETGERSAQRIDIDQLAMVLLPLYLGKVGMRPRTQFANEPPF